MQTIFGVSLKTVKIEESIRFLNEKGYEVSRISLIMKEEEDIPHTYFQKLDLIDDVIGSKEGILPVSIPDLEAVYVAGPITALLGVNATSETYDASNTIIGPLAGGFVNALMDIGVEEEEAFVYRDEIRNGNILIGVSVTSEKQAEEITHFFEKQHITHITTILE